MTQDSRFFDIFSLVLGVCLGIAVLIFIVASMMGGGAQEEIRQEDPRFVAQTVERIKPIAQVAIAGEAEIVDEVVEPQPVQAALSGPQVYNVACQACHAAGVGGAPILGDQSAWQARVTQPREVINDHVLNGFQGELGYMPPKGGRVDLSDEEILAALQFMLDEL